MNGIVYEPLSKTFRIKCGDSLYSFCIGPENLLEHLYWGPCLRDGYDMRYQFLNKRGFRFSGAEWTAVDCIVDEIAAQEDTLMKSNGMHKVFSGYPVYSISEGSAHLQRRLFDLYRANNLVWRLEYLCKQKSLSKQSLLRLQEIVQRGIIGLEKLDYELFSKYKFLRKLPVSFRSSLQSLLAATANTVSNSFEREYGVVGKGGLCLEISDLGTGDFRTPTFLCISPNGSTITPLTYAYHNIKIGKAPMPDHMPSVRTQSFTDATTLVVTMENVMTGLQVDLIYVCMHEYDVLTRRTVYKNASNLYRCHPSFRGTKTLDIAYSMTVDFSPANGVYHLTHLFGSWANEFQVGTYKSHQSILSISSRKGVTGHEHQPFIAVSIGEPQEDYGETKGFALVYSGNFKIKSEVNAEGNLRINVGINPQCFQWSLHSGESFSTPEVILARSSQGLGGLSRVFNRLFLERLILRNTWAEDAIKADDPPIILNTWEAKYFDVNHDGVMELARLGCMVGVNLIVVDDGWFGERMSTMSSVGDWIENPIKFPKGLAGLSDDLHALNPNLKLGIWIEPEMASSQSVLFQDHPDWILSVGVRPESIGRNQYVLDLTNEVVIDYVYGMICQLITRGKVRYIKWDMNRPLTEVFSKTRSYCVSCQDETAHRYVLGLYKLQERIIRAFPGIWIENCASGGGRFDPGMLYFSPQIWGSDNTEPISRMKIQYGASLLYPLRTCSTHISSRKNHLTGRVSTLRTRAIISMSGALGLEFDLATATMNELQELKAWLEVYKSLATVILLGNFYRLWNPFQVNKAAWMFVSLDLRKAVVFVFPLTRNLASVYLPRLQLKGLYANAEYIVAEPIPLVNPQQFSTLMNGGNGANRKAYYQMRYPTVTLTGHILMNAGLPIHIQSIDDALMFTVTLLNFRPLPPLRCESGDLWEAVLK